MCWEITNYKNRKTSNFRSKKNRYFMWIWKSPLIGLPSFNVTGHSHLYVADRWLYNHIVPVLDLENEEEHTPKRVLDQPPLSLQE